MPDRESLESRIAESRGFVSRHQRDMDLVRAKDEASVQTKMEQAKKLLEGGTGGGLLESTIRLNESIRVKEARSEVLSDIEHGAKWQVIIFFKQLMKCKLGSSGMKKIVDSIRLMSYSTPKNIKLTISLNQV